MINKMLYDLYKYTKLSEYKKLVNNINQTDISLNIKIKIKEFLYKLILIFDKIKDFVSTMELIEVPN